MPYPRQFAGPLEAMLATHDVAFFSQTVLKRGKEKKVSDR